MIGTLLSVVIASQLTLAAAFPPLRHGAPPPPGVGGEVSLIDHRGAPFSFRQLRGEPALVFFGFTRCGTSCPIAMVQAKQVLAALEGRGEPNILLVTLDPLSDGPAEMARYLRAIDPRLRGLTGTPRQVHQAAQRFGVGVRGYDSGAIEHSSVWYLVDSNARVLRVYPLSTPAADLAQDLLAARAITVGSR